MKINRKYRLIILLVIGTSFSCENALEEEIFSDLNADNYLTTETGIESLLFSAYKSQSDMFQPQKVFAGALPSGEIWGRSGSWENRTSTPLTEFVWQSTDFFLPLTWESGYRIVRDANLVLANLEGGEFSQEFKTLMEGEARALRAFAYHTILSYYGPGPLFTEETTDLILPRASEDEMKNFIEQELLAAANSLPVNQADWGRMTKGAALATLCKFYLNTRQWQKSADIAEQIINLGKYELESDYTSNLTADNFNSKEIIHVVPKSVTSQSMWLICVTLPTDYPRLPNQGTCAAVIYANDFFVDSFEDGDVRKNLLVTEYVNTAGETITGYGKNETLVIKYPLDPNANGIDTGNDYAEVRYADILLARAEALNELNGPNQESIDLINQVRTRAQVSNLILADFGTKEALSDHILQERKWEFYFEGKEREDMIRHGKLISNAQARGKSAQDHHILFPIPLTEVQSNSLLDQNPGY